MSDLREKLAARLHAALCTVDMDTYEIPELAELLPLADECIRQMEWARTGWIASKDNNGSMFYTKETPPVPLTPAPDDWTPTKE